MMLRIFAHSNRLFRGLLLLATCFLACNDTYIYKESKEIAGGGWMYRDTMDFGFEVKDTASLYHIYLDLETADSFSTQNIYLQLHTKFPNGRRLPLVRSFDLYDTQGKSLGEGSGNWRKHHIRMQENAFFNQKGTYTITVGSFMRFEPLTGVRSVGISVENTKKNRADKK